MTNLQKKMTGFMHTCKNAPDSLTQIKNCADTLSIKFNTSLNPDVNLNLLCANYVSLPEMFHYLWCISRYEMYF